MRLPADRQVPGTGQHALRVPGQGALEEVVSGLAVGERAHVGEDQPFHGIDDVGVIIKRVKGQFLILDAHPLTHVPRRIDGLIGRQRDAGGVRARNGGVLTQWASRRADDFL
jgi:hypothetical protein